MHHDDGLHSHTPGPGSSRWIQSGNMSVSLTLLRILQAHAAHIAIDFCGMMSAAISNYHKSRVRMTSLTVEVRQEKQIVLILGSVTYWAFSDVGELLPISFDLLLFSFSANIRTVIHVCSISHSADQPRLNCGSLSFSLLRNVFWIRILPSRSYSPYRDKWAEYDDVIVPHGDGMRSLIWSGPKIPVAPLKLVNPIRKTDGHNLNTDRTLAFGKLGPGSSWSRRTIARSC